MVRLTCSFHVKRLSMVTQRSLVVSTTWSGVPMETTGGGAAVVKVMMCMRTVLFSLTVTLFSLVQY